MARYTSIRGKQIKDEVAGLGLSKDSNGNFQVNVDDSTIEISSDSLQVKDRGIGNIKLALDAVDETILDLTKTYDFATEGGTLKVGTPTNDTDVANKSYVDSVAQGLDAKDSVKCASTSSDGNITLSGLTQTIDGVSLSDGDRVLLLHQSDLTENGIWVAHSGSWTRPDDFDTGMHVAGAYCFVEDGTSNSDSGWVCTNDDPNDVVDTDNLNFTQFSGAGQINAGAGLTKSGNTLNVGQNPSGGITVNADDIALNPDNSTIEINGSNQVQVKDLGITESKLANDAVTESKLAMNNSPSDGYVISWNGTGSYMEWTDITNLISSTYVQRTDYTRDDFTSQCDGSQTTFTLTNTPVANSLIVTLNGSVMCEGSGKDFTLSGNQITFSVAPESGDVLLAFYVKSA